MVELLNIVPQQILDEVSSYVKEGVAHPPLEYTDPEGDWCSYVPDPAQLQAVINAVFWASMEHEELRPVMARVSFGAPRATDCRLEPLPLTSLRRLSPFFDRGTNVVYCSKDLELIGIGPLSDVEVCVRTERPGTVVISQYRRVLAVLEESGWHLVNRDAEGLASVLGGIFGSSESSTRKAWFLISLATWARTSRRGAMFVTTPPNAHDGLEKPPAYRVQEFPAVRQALAELAAMATSFEFLENMWGYHQKRTQANSLRDLFGAVVSAGGGIDGAALLDETDLHPVGFGVKINAPPDTKQVHLLRFPETEPVWVDKASLGGTRHQSAARLVQTNNAANVVTVSQDGTISWFTWDAKEQCVVVVKHIDRFLRAETA